MVNNTLTALCPPIPHLDSSLMCRNLHLAPNVQVPDENLLHTVDVVAPLGAIPDVLLLLSDFAFEALVDFTGDSDLRFLSEVVVTIATAEG